MITTTDHLLDGRVTLIQHRKGYRVAIDPVFLAAAVPAKGDDRVLEPGCGSGAAALCLATRVPGIHVTGLELQTHMLELARLNMAASAFGDAISVMDGDVASPPADLIPGSFDHVMTNPPYRAAGQGNPPSDPVKAMATVESHVPLAGWVETAYRMLKTGGTLTMVHRADRVGEITRLMAPWFGGIVVCPLWPGPDRLKPAKRILVQGTRVIIGQMGAETNPAVRTTEGVILHDGAGAYTNAADQVLRNGQPLIL